MLFRVLANPHISMKILVASTSKLSVAIRPPLLSSVSLFIKMVCKEIITMKQKETNIMRNRTSIGDNQNSKLKEL